MDRIRNAIKCAICREILESPVFLPCSDPICTKHASNQTNDVIRCEKCGIEHRIPITGFPPIPFLEEIIKSEFGQFDFGSVHKEAKRSCESVHEALKEALVLFRDPYFYTHEKISELKNNVQLKGEELKLIIDQEMKKLIDKLEEYDKQCRDYLSSNEFKEESKKLENEMKLAQTNLDSWLESLNKIKFDEDKWKSIREESSLKLKRINEESEKFRNKLLLNKFKVNQKQVNLFKCIKIDSIFEYGLTSVSRIINESSAQKLEELLQKKDLNSRKWSLLYQGSRDGFQASDFHTCCDNNSNTLTIVKSENGNIFGGFTSAHWKSSAKVTWQYDKKAFIFSLVNKENRPLIFEHSSSDQKSIGSHSKYGPIFGALNDFCIYDKSNENTISQSNLGRTYTHLEFPFDSQKAQTILAGSANLKVQEIEVFQMRQ